VRFGPAGREVFGDRFFLAVLKEFLRETSRELRTDALGKALRDTYSRRQIEYTEYEVLIPKKNDPLKGTLYWEFSKILLSFMNDTNPATLMFLNLLVADMTKIMLNDALKVEQVLRG
jgi:hypothetical protein